MAINIKALLANGLLELCEEMPLELITIKQLLNKTEVSRQTFYNHFKDKNDLIQYIYLEKIIPRYNNANTEIDFYESLLDTFKRMKKYHVFMKQACLMEDQNCLRDYIFDHCKQFDLEWHQHLYGEKPMPSFRNRIPCDCFQQYDTFLDIIGYASQLRRNGIINYQNAWNWYGKTVCRC